VSAAPGRAAPAGEFARAALAAEWTKIRSVRSTAWALTLTVLISACLGYAVALILRGDFSHLPPNQREHFDPLFATFYSLTLGQLALVVFGVLVVSGEYTSGTIRASLAAMPRRGRYYGAKILAGTLVALPVCLVTVAITFAAAQWALGPHRTSMASAASVQASLGACLYLTLMCALAMGVAAALRSSARALGILLPLLFLGSQGLGNVPVIKTVTQYLPDQAGMVIMHLTGVPGDPRFSRPYGPWEGLGILALWTAAALACGYLVLARADA
jgi:ABC-type transport system involved in multi-copper enzyme maturation permease subunit